METQPMPFPESLQDAMVYFADPKRGFDFMCGLRWPEGKVLCPHCQSERVSLVSTRRIFKCMNKACHKQFSPKVGTIFEDSALGYDKWFPAMWMVVNAKNGISSYEISRSLKVTQKTAWFMLHRIRLAMGTGNSGILSGEVEADESYIGGKLSRMNTKQRKGRDWKNDSMIPVAGLLQRSNPEKLSRVKLKALSRVNMWNLNQHIAANVEKGSQIFTDAHKAYRQLGRNYSHEFVDHAISYVQGKVHTNGLENFWNLLKRTIRGTYVSVDPVHLHRYLDEQVFRFNERKGSDGSRFAMAARGILGHGLSYFDLIEGKGGEDLPPQISEAW